MTADSRNLPKNPPNLYWKWIVWPLLAAIAVRAGWAHTFHPTPVSDFAWYFERAISIAQGRGYSVDGAPTAFWPVGYPGALGILFAFTGPSLLAAKVLNLLAAAMSVVLTALVAARLQLPRPVGIVAAWIVALNPNTIAYVALLASEPLSTAILLAAVERHLAGLNGDRTWRTWLVGGILYGLAILCKPHTVLVPIAVTIAAHGPGKWRTGLSLLGVGLLTVLPWCLRNSLTFGRPLFVSTNGGYNLLIGANPEADGKWMEVRTDLERGSAEGEYDRVFQTKAVDFITSRPLDYLQLAPLKIRNLFAPGNEGLHWTVAGTDKLDTARRSALASLKPIASVYSAGLGLLALIGLFRGIRSRSAWICAAIVGVFLLTAAVFFGESRFLLPASPFLAILTAIAFSGAGSRSPGSASGPEDGGDRSSPRPKAGRSGRRHRRTDPGGLR